MAAKKVKGEAQVAQIGSRLETLTVEYVDIGSIEPNTYNPNRQSERDFELLKRSMDEDGFTQPVIVQKASKEIVDGEHRWRAAKELGYTKIPVVFVDMAVEQMRISTLRHNRARGSEDVELAAEVLRDLRELGALTWAKDSLMLDDKEINRLLDDTPVPDLLAGDEFAQAWEPAVERNNDAPAVVGEVMEVGASGQALKEPILRGATQMAVDRMAAAAATLEAAQTGTERYAIVQARQVYRLSMVFTGAEAVSVKSALGNEPAVRVLELCKADLAERGIVIETGETPAAEAEAVAVS